MANLLPPMPVGVPPGHSFWNDWYEKLRYMVNNLSSSIDWSLITNKPTTLGGYGITDAQTKLNNSAGLAAALSDETGSGLAVFNTSPTLVTPNIGAAEATSVRATGAATVNTGATSVSVGTVSGFPYFSLTYSGAAADTKMWDTLATSTQLRWRAVNDAVSSSNDWLAVNRTGTTINYVNFPNGNFGIGVIPSGSYKLEVNGALSISSATMIRTATSFTNGAGAAAGTLNNAPTAGNPSKWVPIDDNGTTRYIPAW